MVEVLIADDSKLTRTILRDVLERDPEIRVVGEASDGREAVDATCRLRPDLVIMDVVMPVMDGLTAVDEIMGCCPTPILVLSAAVDRDDALCAFNAIEHGALDVMEKPRGMGAGALEEVGGRLVEKVKFLARIRVMHHFRRRRTVAMPAAATEGPRDILVIGASTGGPKAVMRLMKALSRSTGARVLICQHIARGFAAGFAEWLDGQSAFSVRLAREGDRLEEGVALVAPNDLHMEVEGERIVLRGAPPVNSCRPAVDVLFRSLARDLAPRVVAVLLTGMGRDGADGMIDLKNGGAYNIAQDEATSAVFGMPRAAIRGGGVHQTLSLDEISSTLTGLLRPFK